MSCVAVQSHHFFCSAHNKPKKQSFNCGCLECIWGLLSNIPSVTSSNSRTRIFQFFPEDHEFLTPGLFSGPPGWVIPAHMVRGETLAALLSCCIFCFLVPYLFSSTFLTRRGRIYFFFPRELFLGKVDLVKLHQLWRSLDQPHSWRTEQPCWIATGTTEKPHGQDQSRGLNLTLLPGSSLPGHHDVCCLVFLILGEMSYLSQRRQNSYFLTRASILFVHSSAVLSR